MVRFPLEIGDYVEAAGVLSIQGVHLGLPPMRFLVDTGSPQTTLGYGEFLRLRIPESLLRFHSHIQVGGSTHERLILPRKVFLYLKTEEQKSIKWSLPECGVLRPTAKHQDAIRAAQSFPSIMGLDFLRLHQLTLVCNPAAKTAYLETGAGIG